MPDRFRTCHKVTKALGEDIYNCKQVHQVTEIRKVWASALTPSKYVYVVAAGGWRHRSDKKKRRRPLPLPKHLECGEVCEKCTAGVNFFSRIIARNHRKSEVKGLTGTTRARELRLEKSSLLL